MSTDCGITIVTKTERAFIPLKPEDARNFRLLLETLKDKPAPNDAEEAKRFRARSAQVNQAIEDLQLGKTNRLAEMDHNDLRLIVGLIELIEHGDHHLDGGNWILSAVWALLTSVTFDGPAAAISGGPSHFLRSFAADYEAFLGWLDNAKSLAEAYPSLFESHPSQAAAPKPEPASKKRIAPAKKAARKAA